MKCPHMVSNIQRRAIISGRFSFLRFMICFGSAIGIVAIAAAQKAIDTVYVDWHQFQGKGAVSATFGNIAKVIPVSGKAKVRGNEFAKTSVGPLRIMIILSNVVKDPGPEATVVQVTTNHHAFSFFLRDVTQRFPVNIPEYEVAVLSAGDKRKYAEVKQYLAQLSLSDYSTALNALPETDYAHAKDEVRAMHTPVWLGIGRDFRIFQFAESMPGSPQEACLVTPQWAASSVPIAEMKNSAASYTFNVGRGQGVQLNTKRWLQDSVLPIVHSLFRDDDMSYHSTTFVTLENATLNNENIKGTHYLVADYFSHGHMFTEKQQADLKPRLNKPFDSTQTTLFTYRCVAKNEAAFPKYAWFKVPSPGAQWWQQYPYRFDSTSGLSAFADDRIFCISALNGKPVRNEEIAILLQPGEEAVFEFLLPHMPVSKDRARLISHYSFNQKFGEAIFFWRKKLESAAKIEVPEPRINNMLRAGLLHLDLITYGQQAPATLAPCIGVYSPIGTESAPIIQFYASMGWHDQARRSLNYFLDKQHEDGMIQNFGGYMVETGAALWSMGEYFRYTKDSAWVIQNKHKIVKACDFLFAWRNRNKKEGLKGKGYGMIDGKVADPEDQFHQFMLNGYAYLGCIRVAEMLQELDPAESKRINTEAQDWRGDIRSSFFQSMANSPVVPLQNGSWTSTIAPWPEMTGPRALYVNRDRFFSHGTFTTADGLLGPLYLAFCEVLDVNESVCKKMLEYHQALFYQQNTAFSQPYYSRHNWLQIKLGMVKPFLKTYYNSFAALADRDIYTFWEHLYKVSVHKTHEEAWFLMETRWMLYMEEKDTLQLFKTIPRQWLENTKEIRLNGVSSYFGPLNASVVSKLAEGHIIASVSCPTNSGLKSVVIRVPHPEGKKALRVSGGVYNAAAETVTISDFKGNSSVVLYY